MPMRCRAILLAAALLAPLVAPLVAAVPAWADGRCDLNALVGYFLVFGKPIEAYIQDGNRVNGYAGCEPDRVLVFSDNTGVRCKDLVRQTAGDLPIGYLFVRQNMGDMQLCVDGLLMAVSQTN